jgi:hypothetical protein
MESVHEISSIRTCRCVVRDLRVHAAIDVNSLAATINGTLLKNIKNLKSPDAVINCGTCHNGRARPGAGSAAMPQRPGAP